jgi:hypothetical protein
MYNSVLEYHYAYHLSTRSCLVIITQYQSNRILYCIISRLREFKLEIKSPIFHVIPFDNHLSFRTNPGRKGEVFTAKLTSSNITECRIYSGNKRTLLPNLSREEPGNKRTEGCLQTCQVGPVLLEYILNPSLKRSWSDHALKTLICRITRSLPSPPAIDFFLLSSAGSMPQRSSAQRRRFSGSI